MANYLHERRQPTTVTQVSLRQAAQIVGDVVSLSASSLRRLRRIVKRSGKPAVEAQRGIPARWEWSDIRPLLAREFGCNLPTRCPLVEPGMSIATSNDYIAAARNFGNC